MIRLKTLLKEELIGQYRNIYDIYKNPKSIKRMEPSLRGISMPNGDLYVIDDGYTVLHFELSHWLKANGYALKMAIMGSGASIGKNFKAGYIGWQRDGSSNEMWIGESSGQEYLDGVSKKEYDSALKKYVPKVQRKNPGIKFVTTSIWDK